ncbi:6-O-methylguanine DNA methyltransferase [Methylobacterium sp. Leaf111]|uniref:bifunctional DNA-binding transcriptional regulator/O6-methylguanine-DNA methyltransferase Ada n=1 Tax=Methylobacterium sp. Leaf111 TaxID=1736257 RepID=UPI0006FAC11B|nr:bifunctional DNA-binding transcriptional regulator/O6-methylguanine-DNA methyltransferase Ada [Methylobacterium sp. Leaf111]KQP60031.1 6-O-methylguanine DNA methyltransferase [Methylobacterium sp. Leaf111]
MRRADTHPEWDDPSAPDDADAQRWAALIARDARADGTFVYAVRTTGVYCRPSCPSRAANPENVSFHATCDAAEAAGFRPCRRCRPNDVTLAERHAAAIVRACRLIEAAETMPTLEGLAAEAGLSAFHFHRVFRRVTGITPKAYATAKRAERVAQRLPEAGTVTEAVFAAGFNASSRFYAEGPDRLGMRPSAYRTGGAGTAIRFAVAACSLGALLVAATPKGLCAILLGDDPDALVRDLQDRFPRADLAPGDPAFDGWVATVVGFVEAPGRGLDLPLDIGGTIFQQRVWAALRAVPIGTTTTYGAIAQAIGAPTSMRAVAQACGANRLAVAIPCHRVVRADGSLSGYRWGVARKRQLLDREADAR